MPGGRPPSLPPPPTSGGGKRTPTTRRGSIELHNPEQLGPHPGFSHAASAAGLVFLGGQIGSDASGRVVAAGDLAAQFRQAIRNVATALAAAGARPADVIKLTYLVTDREAYRAALKPIGEAYREVFGRHYPATSLFEVKGLFDREALVEIECVAVRGAGGQG